MMGEQVVADPSGLPIVDDVAESLQLVEHSRDRDCFAVGAVAEFCCSSAGRDLRPAREPQRRAGDLSYVLELPAAQSLEFFERLASFAVVFVWLLVVFVVVAVLVLVV